MTTLSYFTESSGCDNFLYLHHVVCNEWVSHSLTHSLMFSIAGTRFDDGAGGDNEVQRTMLELINQLDGFDPRGNIKVLMATNR